MQGYSSFKVLASNLIYNIKNIVIYYGKKEKRLSLENGVVFDMKKERIKYITIFAITLLYESNIEMQGYSSFKVLASNLIYNINPLEFSIVLAS